jgi:DNA-3-methyladenine glycosylase II
LEQFTFTIRPLPPFRLDLTVWALRRRPENRIDLWDGQVYRRVAVLDGAPVMLSVVQSKPREEAQLLVSLSGEAARPSLQAPAIAFLEKSLGLQRDLKDFYKLSATDSRLEPLVRRFYGLKPPRFPTLFECLVNAIACQQVTLTLGIRMVNRLAARYGVSHIWEDQPAYDMPDAVTLAALDEDALRPLQFSRQKARAIIRLARLVAEDPHFLESSIDMADQAALEYLCQLHGVGRWTAEYALLRGMGRLHVFPADDVGARNGLQRWLDLAESPDYAAIQRLLANWQPFAGFVYFHLLLKHLADQGQLVENQ